MAWVWGQDCHGGWVEVGGCPSNPSSKLILAVFGSVFRSSIVIVGLENLKIV